MKLSAEMDKAAGEHELAETEVDSLRPFYMSLAGIEVRLKEAARRENLAEEYCQRAQTSPPWVAVTCVERAESYTADAAYLRAEADRMDQQLGFTEEEKAWARAQTQTLAADAALEAALHRLGQQISDPEARPAGWEWLSATDEEGGGPTGPHPLFTGDATEPIPAFVGAGAVWMPAGCDFRQRVIGGERPDECPTYWADDDKCVCDLPVDQLPWRIATSLDDRYMEGRQDAMNGRYNSGWADDEDYRRGHHDALVEQGWQDAMNGRYNIDMEGYEDYRRGHHYGSAERARMTAMENRVEVNALAAQVMAKQLAGGPLGDASYWQDAYDNVRSANKDLKAELDYVQIQLNEAETAAGRVHECPDGRPDCPQCALNRKVEAANAAAGIGDRVPRGLLPTAVVWEDEDTGGWRVAFSDGECPGMSLGPFLGVEQARAAAARLGYKEDRQFVYPTAGGPFRRLCDYSGEVRWDSDASSYLVENCLESRELRSSYLVTARSDDEAIAAALAECSEYLDEWTGDYGPEETPPVYAEIRAVQRDGEVRHIYARPEGMFRPATAYYTCPENMYTRADVFTNAPDPADLRWAADYWSHVNGGKPPPITIRSGERLDARIRDLRGDNTPGAVLSL